MPSIHNLSPLIKDRILSPYDLIVSCLERIRKLDSLLRAFVSILPEDVLLDKAKKSEKLILHNKYIGPLHGIPYSVKDMIHTKGLRCTAGSKIDSNRVSKKNALLVRRLNKQGAILIGTNNLNEFASGITGKNSVFGDSKNPHDLSRISGGSSGGSAVAVSTGMVAFAIGTDTGGSVRVPSSLCGIVGLKPTYNSISMKGILPLAPSLDHVGIIARTVADSFLIYDKICKKRKFGLNGMLEEYSLSETDEFDVDLIPTLGYPRNYFVDIMDEEVRKNFEKFLKTLQFAGYPTREIHFRKSDKYYPTWKTVRLFEAAQVNAKHLQVDSGQISEYVKRMLIEGTRISAKDYREAKSVIKVIKKDFELIFEKQCDIIILPTVPILAPKLRQVFNGNEERKGSGNKMLTRDLLLRNTVLFNSIGFPAMSMPISRPNNDDDSSFLPVGLQLVSSPQNQRILKIMGEKFEKLLWQASFTT